jgi:FAD/FMN-containing dehydrogenase/Fe-S oxidoreductase
MSTEPAATIAADLKDQLEGEVYADMIHRVAFSTDASIYRIVPACVVMPRSVEDVVTTVRYASDNTIDIVARGAGSGIAGEALCAGIVFDMTKYFTEIEVLQEGAMVTCGAGAVLDDVNQRLLSWGRKIGPDPSSGNRATIGGCVANNATGSHSLQYDHFDKYVHSIEVVLADGTQARMTNQMPPTPNASTRCAGLVQQCHALLHENDALIREAQPASLRNRSGYTLVDVCQDEGVDMARLLSGCEGTLAIFTEVTLRTVEIPAAKGLLQLEFASLDQLARAVPKIVDLGATACELMDKSLLDMAVEALPQYRDLFPQDAAAVLLVEQVGDTEKEVRNKLKATRAAVKSLIQGATDVLDTIGQQRLWKSRKDAVPLLFRERGKKQPIGFIEDASVENTKLVDYVKGLQKISEVYGVSMSYFGHAGDGELHVRPYLDLNDPEDVQKMRDMAEDVFTLLWSLGGVISGEHAEGLVRAPYVRRQYGDDYYEILKLIKGLFDPKGILNPGKILNDDPDCMVKHLKRAPAMKPERLESPLVFNKDELAFEIMQCNGCGLCRSRNQALRMCPVFRATGDELAASRAKATVLDYWATGQMDDETFESPEFRQLLDKCVFCKACQTQCPSGVDVAKLMAAARAEYVKRKGLRRPELFFSNNRVLCALGSACAPLANWALSIPLLGWAMEKGVGIDRRRTMPRFKSGFFVKKGRRFIKHQGPVIDPVDRVVYFVDTYAGYNAHALGEAVLTVLKANRIEVVLPKQRPAPLPAISYGDVKRVQKDFLYSLEYIVPYVKKGYKVVCSEPSAALALRDELRHFVDSDEARLVSDHTYELMNYLLMLDAEGKLTHPKQTRPIEYAYHQPCHLEVVGQRAGLTLLESLCHAKILDLSAGCCGLSGTYGMQSKNYDLSEKMADSLKKALQAAPTRYVLTECGACKMQIEHLRPDCTVLHPITVLAKAYGPPGLHG